MSNAPHLPTWWPVYQTLLLRAGALSASWKPAHRHRLPPNGAATPPRDYYEALPPGDGPTEMVSGKVELCSKEFDVNEVFAFFWVCWGMGIINFHYLREVFVKIWEDLAQEENS